MRFADVAAGGGAPMSVTARVMAGSVALSVPPSEAVRILTGAPIPEGADTVFMQEDVRVEDLGRAHFPAGLQCGDNIRSARDDVAKGPINRNAFETYVERVLVPEVRKGDIVVMDNLSSHKATNTRQMIQATSASLLYLRPYSPDFPDRERLRQAQGAPAQGRRANRRRPMTVLPETGCGFLKRPMASQLSPPMITSRKVALKSGARIDVPPSP